MAEREIHFKLVADVSEYMAAMREVSRAPLRRGWRYWVQTATVALMGTGIGAAAVLLLTQ